MAEETPLFVAREDDVAALSSTYAKVLEGTPQAIRIQSPFGGGRRALVGEFLRNLDKTTDEPIVWRVVCLDQENGLQWLVRMYGSLIATLSSDILRRGKIEMVLNSQLPAQPKRVQDWYQEFIGALKESSADSEKGTIQLRMPRDNPLIGLVEIVAAIGRRQPIILELQNPNVVYSLLLSQFVECLMNEARASGAKILTVLFDEPEDEVTKALFPMPLLDYYSRNEDSIAVHTHPLVGCRRGPEVPGDQEPVDQERRAPRRDRRWTPRVHRGARRHPRRVRSHR